MSTILIMSINDDAAMAVDATGVSPEAVQTFVEHVSDAASRPIRWTTRDVVDIELGKNKKTSIDKVARDLLADVPGDPAFRTSR